MRRSTYAAALLAVRGDRARGVRGALRAGRHLRAGVRSRLRWGRSVGRDGHRTGGRRPVSRARRDDGQGHHDSDRHDRPSGRRRHERGLWPRRAAGRRDEPGRRRDAPDDGSGHRRRRATRGKGRREGLRYGGRRRGRDARGGRARHGVRSARLGQQLRRVWRQVHRDERHVADDVQRRHVLVHVRQHLPRLQRNDRPAEPRRVRVQGRAWRHAVGVLRHRLSSRAQLRRGHRRRDLLRLRHRGHVQRDACAMDACTAFTGDATRVQLRASPTSACSTRTAAAHSSATMVCSDGSTPRTATAGATIGHARRAREHGDWRGKEQLRCPADG